MKDLTCNACGKVAMQVRMVDFGFAIVFCVDCANRAVRTGLIAKFTELGGTGVLEVHDSREDA